MAIKFKCPKCGKSFSVREQDAGKKGKCPCGAIISVPAVCTKSPESQDPVVASYRLSDEIEDAKVTAQEPKTGGVQRTTAQRNASSQAQPPQLKCPKCGSTQIMGTTKGFGGFKAVGGALLAGPVGLLAGLHGSKKMMVGCLSCGHTWPAGKRR